MIDKPGAYPLGAAQGPALQVPAIILPLPSMRIFTEEFFPQSCNYKVISTE